MNNGDRHLDLRKLRNTAIVRGSVALVFLGFLLFLPAGTFGYWEAWLYLAIVAGAVIGVTTYFVRKDPELLERRMRVKEKDPGQRKIIAVGWVVFLVNFLLPGYDRRCGWSEVPLALVLAADGCVLAGYLIFFAGMKANRYASRTIGIDPGQAVITTGPYAVVRHPLYAGALLMYLCTPVALGSYWAILAAVWFVPVLVARILNEERMLSKELEQYAEYARRTKYRLVPGVW